MRSFFRLLTELKRIPSRLKSSKSASRSVFEELALYSYLESHSLRSLHDIARDVVDREIPGEFVECGVFNGGSAAALAMALRPRDDRFWLYDSFEGLPEPSPRDGSDAPRWTGQCVGAVEAVQAAFALVEFPAERLVIRKGWFQDTFREGLPSQVALLHIDADWYASVLLSLETFYDRVSDGGVVILDDFGYWEGCRLAYYEFVKRRNLAPLLERRGHTQAYWIKGREHHRAIAGTGERIWPRWQK